MGSLKSQDYLNEQILSDYLPNKDLMLKIEWVRSLQTVKRTVKEYVSVSVGLRALHLQNKVRLYKLECFSLR